MIQLQICCGGYLIRYITLLMERKTKQTRSKIKWKKLMIVAMVCFHSEMEDGVRGLRWDIEELWIQRFLCFLYIALWGSAIKPEERQSLIFYRHTYNEIRRQCYRQKSYSWHFCVHFRIFNGLLLLNMLWLKRDNHNLLIDISTLRLRRKKIMLHNIFGILRCLYKSWSRFFLFFFLVIRGLVCFFNSISTVYRYF